MVVEEEGQTEINDRGNGASARGASESSGQRFHQDAAKNVEFGGAEWWVNFSTPVAVICVVRASSEILPFVHQATIQDDVRWTVQERRLRNPGRFEKNFLERSLGTKETPRKVRLGQQTQKRTVTKFHQMLFSSVVLLTYLRLFPAKKKNRQTVSSVNFSYSKMEDPEAMLYEGESINISV